MLKWSSIRLLYSAQVLCLCQIRSRQPESAESESTQPQTSISVVYTRFHQYSEGEPKWIWGCWKQMKTSLRTWRDRLCPGNVNEDRGFGPDVFYLRRRVEPLDVSEWWNIRPFHRRDAFLLLISHRDFPHEEAKMDLDTQDSWKLCQRRLDSWLCAMCDDTDLVFARLPEATELLERAFHAEYHANDLNI